MTRILLVEHDAAQLKCMQDVLQKSFEDYTINAAGSLAEAKAKLVELRAVSLIVVDYQLPDGTGYDLLDYCRGRLTDVPIILIAENRRDDEKKFGPALSFQKGAFDFMRKPLDYDEFIERIKRAIEIAKALA